MTCGVGAASTRANAQRTCVLTCMLAGAPHPGGGLGADQTCHASLCSANPRPTLSCLAPSKHKVIPVRPQLQVLERPPTLQVAWLIRSLFGHHAMTPVQSMHDLRCWRSIHQSKHVANMCTPMYVGRCASPSWRSWSTPASTCSPLLCQPTSNPLISPNSTYRITA